MEVGRVKWCKKDVLSTHDDLAHSEIHALVIGAACDDSDESVSAEPSRD